MKKLICIIAISAMSTNLFAGDDTPASKAHANKYCAKMKDGKLTVMHEGKALTTDATLANGTQVRTDGTVIKKDGTKTMLREGQCMDKDGKVMEENSKEKK